MTIVQLDKDCLKALIEGNGGSSEDLSQLHAKDTELTNRVNVLEEAKPVVENKLNEIEAKNTSQDEKITALENRTDNFVNNVAVSKEGKKVKLTYTRVDGTSSEVEFEDSDTVTLAYDDEPLKARIKALEDKPDKDTIYNDTEVKQSIKANEASITALEGDVTALRTHTDSRLEALENKADNDTTYDDTAVRGQITALETKVNDNKNAQDAKNTELENKITALETKPDKDTVYDDSDLKEQVNDLGSSVASVLHDISEIRVNNEQRLSALESKEDKDKQTLSLEGNTLSISNGNSVELPKYDDTALKAKGTEQEEAINTLKDKTKSFLTGASLARHDDVVTLTYTNIDGTSTNLEFSDHDTKALAYDDTALKARVQELENKTDKDTVYDDAPIKTRISALESKEDKDTKYNVKSATSGVTVTKSEENGENVFTINADEVLKNLASKDEVSKAIAENNKRTATVASSFGTYTDETKFSYGYDDRKPAFVYNDVTHFGTFKVDGFIKGDIYADGSYIAKMPEGSPKPLVLMENLIYINNKPVNVYMNTDGNVRVNGVTSDMIGQRIVTTFIGLFA